MTYKGGWFNIPSNNQRIKETGIMIFKFKEGKITELWFENSDAACSLNWGLYRKTLIRPFKMVTSVSKISADNFFLSRA